MWNLSRLFLTVLTVLWPILVYAESSFKIGVISSLDPIGAPWSISANAGFEAAAKEINNEGGINGRAIELLFEDDRFDPKSAISAYRKLRTKGVRIFLGPQFEQTLTPVIPIAIQEDSLIITTIASTPANKNFEKAVIHSVPADKLAAKCLADAISNDERKRILLIMPEESYSQTFAGYVEASLGSVERKRINYLPESPDFNALLMKAKQFRPDALVLFFVTAEAAVDVFRKLDAMHFNTAIYSNEVVHESKILLSKGGPAVIGTKYCGVRFDPSDARIAALLKSLPSAPPLPVYTALAYDTLHWLAEVLAQVGDDTKLLRSAIARLNYSGVMTSYSFDALGDLQFKDFVVYQVVRDGFLPMADPR